MLSRLQVEQTFLTKHAHVPTRQLTAALNVGAQGDGDVMCNMFRHMIFNWLPIEPPFEFHKSDVVQVESRTDCGLLWNCVMLDQTTVQIHPTWDDAQLERDEVKDIIDDLSKIENLFATEETWTKKVGDVV